MFHEPEVSLPRAFPRERGEMIKVLVMIFQFIFAFFMLLGAKDKDMSFTLASGIFFLAACFYQNSRR